MEQILANNVPEIIEINSQAIILFGLYKCEPCDLIKEALYIILEEEKAFDVPFIVAYSPMDQEKLDSISETFGLRMMPTTRIYRNGQIIAEKRGALKQSLTGTTNTFRRWLEKNLQK